MKSTIEEIRHRFDNDVERFSNLETGQSATMDAPLALELVAGAAAAVNPHAKSLLDVGCGAGNYSLKLLQSLPDMNITLVDLSAPMLERAAQRVGMATKGVVETVQSDIRELELDESRFDVIVAAAMLHHLREEEEWREVFAKLHRALRPGGSLWIFDLVESSSSPIETLMREHYADYLTQLRDAEYARHVFDYIEREDTPRSLLFQLELLRASGFEMVEVLHKNCCFAAFGGVKAQ